MIKMEKLEVFGFEAALRGMRNAMNSWHLSDSMMILSKPDIGPNDLKLLLNLTRAGESHRKVLRMMHIQMDVTAPLYWWKDYDTYKVGTVANSCSTMHKIHAKEFTIADFSVDKLTDTLGENMMFVITGALNHYRTKFIESGMKDKDAWYAMIQLLPTSYMQKRTIDINYEVALKILTERRHHKLDEFRKLCEFLLENVPYLKELFEASINE